MGNSHLTMAEKVAHAVRDFPRQRTGHAPELVTVVLSEGTLVVTLSRAGRAGAMCRRVGVYRGRFVLASHGGGDEDNKVEVHLTVDPDKARDDANAVEAKARELTGSEGEKPPSGPSEADVKRNDE